MKLTNIAFYILTPILLAIIVICGYYIAANTFLAGLINPKVIINDQQVALESGNPTELVAKTLESLPTEITVVYEGNSYVIPITPEDLIILNLDQIQSFGRGADITKVLADGATWAAGQNIEVKYQVNPDILIKNIPHPFSARGAKLNGNSLNGCETGKYDLALDREAITAKLSEAVTSGSDLTITNDDLVVNNSDLSLISECLNYNSTLAQIQIGFVSNGLSLPNTLTYRLGTGWEITDQNELRTQLQNLKSRIDKPLKEGKYKIIRSRIAVLTPYQVGEVLNVESSLSNIDNWLKNPSGAFPIVKLTTYPEVFSKGLPVLDFTKRLGAGKTRIDLIRNGKTNWVVPYAEYGVRAMHDQLIMPGEQFSYIDAINPQPGGWMENGFPIGSGICNSSTTLFRAALESGFPITDRSSHPTYIESYNWGYPINLVDAAYLTEPRVDMKFINDLDYPVLLQAKIVRDDKSGWQYHTIEILTSQEAPQRKVSLYDFKILNQITPKRYLGSFKRLVVDNGAVTRQNTFRSDYR